ncbi:hypothetical protein GCWU000325_00995 [Alloprevotella tannerae ATCC 51259]|uniref:Uncharacterized protein n=1 Tax=Alloprevotella tannerae ATCC 51259 TaxID=626522 RepID=C9LFL2_9BACT|nr:hypothetical protein GCWU000325_00995 [Alloprevotella tannerae ATCC 51259]
MEKARSEKIAFSLLVGGFTERHRGRYAPRRQRPKSAEIAAKRPKQGQRAIILCASRASL